MCSRGDTFYNIGTCEITLIKRAISTQKGSTDSPNPRACPEEWQSMRLMVPHFNERDMESREICRRCLSKSKLLSTTPSMEIWAHFKPHQSVYSNDYIFGQVSQQQSYYMNFYVHV